MYHLHDLEYLTNVLNQTTPRLNIPTFTNITYILVKAIFPRQHITRRWLKVIPHSGSTEPTSIIGREPFKRLVELDVNNSKYDNITLSYLSLQPVS